MIAYTIAIPQPHTHLLHVAMELDMLAGEFLDVALPVWTPGSYMVREFARHVQQLTAEQAGRTCQVAKIDKATWRISTSGTELLRISYQVYAFELTVRTSHCDQSHCFFNPANVCLYVPGHTNQPHLVRMQLPAGWQVATGLRRDPNSDGFLAHDYDELVDSPFECGTHQLLTFEVDSVPHMIALWGQGNHDPQHILHDTKLIVATTRALFPGPLPYDQYLFIVHLTDNQYGGLEHRNSVANQIDRWSFRNPRSYERFLGLTAHEYYHVWNVKRIRPAALGPFDYQRENYTRQLWVAEGITSYYDNLILLRAGLITQERYLEMLAEDISTVESQPGRLVQSLAQSSFDAWIKFYRPDENSPNSSISYYVKGSLVALLLDLTLRTHTSGQRSLDDAMRYLYTMVYGGQDQQRFYNAPGFAEDGGFVAALEELADAEDGLFRKLVHTWVETTAELDYQQALTPFGIEVQRNPVSDGGWLGVKTRVEQGKLKVASVRSNSPAEQAGIYANDELLALDGFRLDDERLRNRLSEHQPGEQVQITLFRGDRLFNVLVTLAEPPAERIQLVPVPNPSDTQRLLQDAWLHHG